MKNVAICTTTIFPIDAFVSEYVSNLRAAGREKAVSIYIAGDRKSPSSCGEVARRYQAEGVDVRFLTIEAQHDYLKKYPDLGAIIPENSDNRRNVAYLMALEEGAQTVVSVDDDNYPTPGEDFIGQHLAVGREMTEPEAIGREGWFNLCSLLLPEASEPQDPRLYPRGFPYKLRQPGTATIAGPAAGRVGVNAGLWTLDPDTDAIGRLYAAPIIKGVTGRNVLLGRGVRCPINTQNTALTREAMAAYYYVRMGSPIRGMNLDRFGDIFSGYFLQVCADAVGDRIRIGSPVAEHRRNKHNLLVDLYQELAGIMICEDLSTLFATVELPRTSYQEAYRTFSVKLEEFAGAQQGFIWTPETVDYFKRICSYMRIWADAVQSLED